MRQAIRQPAGFRIRHVARTDSTQRLALEAARAGCGPWWCAVADEQTAGRGRQGHAWVAPPGAAVLASLVVPILPGGWAALGAGVAVADAVLRLVPTAAADLRLKWPNDVLVGGRKLAGVLVELPGRPADLAVVGIGVDVLRASAPEGAVSLEELAGGAPALREVLDAVLTAVRARWDEAAADGGRALRAAWRSLADLGRPVRAVGPGGVVTAGVADDVDDDGALLVRTGTAVERVIAADLYLGPHGAG